MNPEVRLIHRGLPKAIAHRGPRSFEPRLKNGAHAMGRPCQAQPGKAEKQDIYHDNRNDL